MWAERVDRAYEIALSLLGLRPAEFWLLTPSETADLFIAFRMRENRRLMNEAWKLSYLIADKAAQGHEHELAPVSLFRNMPGSFPDDVPNLGTAGPAVEEGLTEAQRVERERRRNIKRVLRN